MSTPQEPLAKMRSVVVSATTSLVSTAMYSFSKLAKNRHKLAPSIRRAFVAPATGSSMVMFMLYTVQHSESSDRRYNCARNVLICGSREPQLRGVCDFSGDARSVQPHGTVDVQLRGTIGDEQLHCAPDQ